MLTALKAAKNLSKVHSSKIKLQKKIDTILSSGEKICGYGATSKSTTILNYCGIDKL